MARGSVLGQAVGVFAAVLVLAAILRDEAAWLISLPVLHIGLTMAARWAYTRLTRPVLLGLLVAGLGAGATLVCLAIGLGIGPALIALALLALLVCPSAASRPSLLVAVATAPALVCLVLLVLLLLGAGRAQDVTDSMRILLALLAGWPALSLLARGRGWTASILMGAMGVLAVAALLLRQAEVGMSEIFRTQHLSGHGIDGLLALGQTMLVGLIVIPLLRQSAPPWRWTTVLAAVASLGLLLILTLTGPWPEGWPLVAWIALGAALATLAVGGLGMLCTVRHAEAMADAASQALALGVGASAALLLPWAVASDARLLPGLVTALAPLIWASLLAVLLSTAAAIARRYRLHLGAEGLPSGRFVGLRRSWLGGVLISGVAEIRRDGRSLLTPIGIVPFLILAATWPAWPQLGWAVLVPCLLLLALPAITMSKVWLLGWAAIHFSALIVAGLAIGLSPVLVPALASLALLACWLMLRWPVLGLGWGFVGGLMLMMVGQGLLMPQASVTPLISALVLAITILATSALAEGRARSTLMICAALWLLMALLNWSLSRDPYAIGRFRELDPRQELLTQLWRTPGPVLMLVVLWLWRSHGQGGPWSCPRRTRVLLAALATGCALIWAADHRPGMALGLATGLGILVMLPVLIRELRFRVLAPAGLPLVDGAGFLLAALVVTGSKAMVVAAQYDQPIMPPGSLGEVLIEGSRDVLSITLACIVVLGLGAVARQRSIDLEAVGRQLMTSIHAATSRRRRRA